MVFKSAIAWWYWLIVVGTAVALIVATVPALKQASGGSLAIIFGTWLLALGLPIWLALSTRYTIEAEDLLIRSGPFSWTVPRSSIESISPTSSPLSSPALSLDRLEIRYDSGKSILVSPADKDGFIRALESGLK